jgi:endonuclease YncB( thermonuclease family)
MKVSYFYRVAVHRIKDGDTVEMIFDLGFRAALAVTVRLKDVDAPETWRPQTEKERLAGQAVTAYLTKMLTDHATELYCQSESIDLYGRSLGILYYSENGVMININDLLNRFMIDNHLTQAEARLP